ncbi:MAG: hypothetical protein RL217_1898 [Pseudomonadota bacterium]
MQLFVNQLTNVDFSYLDHERGLVGETWLASALLDGALDDEGMLCDFGIVKKTLRNWLDDELDHRLLLPIQHPALSYQIAQDRIDFTFTLNSGEPIRMSAPVQAVALVDAALIDAQSVAAWCKAQLLGHFPVNVAKLTLSFEPEQIEGAYYHYSHGLKKHAGNCQRIAHGHRSRLHIWLDDKRAYEQEAYWAKRWADIYLGLSDDIQTQNASQIDFAYEACQGRFTLSLPAKICYLMHTDTTVEFIAEHLAQEIKNQYPKAQVKVQAFEGINKGAISQR